MGDYDVAAYESLYGAGSNTSYTTTQTTYSNNSNSTMAGYLSGGTSTPAVFKTGEVWDAVTGGFSRKEANNILPGEFDALENFESPADVAARGIFVPGQLYRFNNEKEMTYQYVVLMEDVEKDGTTIVLDARKKETFEGKVFLCLETRWVDGPVTTIVRKGVTKFIDRLWQTVFLSGSKTYTFYWFENPREAEHYGNVQACSKFWEAHLSVLLKGLAGNIGNAVGMSVATNLLNFPNGPISISQATSTNIPTHWNTATYSWSGIPTTTTTTLTATAARTLTSSNTIPSEESFFAMPSREMFIRIS